MLSHVRIAKTRRRPAHPAGTGVPRPGRAGGGGVLSGLLRAGGAAFILQVLGGGWYTDRALGQQLRDTVVPADRGRIYSADGVLLAANSSCWTLRASPREMPEDKLALAAKGLAEILELDEGKLLEKFSDRRSNDCLLRYRVDRVMADAVRDFCEANGITGIRIDQDSKRWYPQGSFWPRCWGSPTWTMQASRGSN